MAELYDCDITLNGIPQDCYGTVGGLTEMWFAKKSDIELLSAESTGAPVLSDMEIAAAGTFKRYYVKKESSGYTINMTSSGGYNIVLTAVFEKLTPEKNYEWEQLKRDQIVAIVKDANGQYWFLGFDNTLEMDLDSSIGETGAAREDDNQYTWVFNDYETRPPYYVPDAIVRVALAQPAPPKPAP